MLDRGLKWTKCSTPVSRFLFSNPLCPSGFLEDVEVRRMTECIDGRVLIQYEAESLVSCPQNVAELPLRITNRALPVMEELCNRLDEASFSEDTTLRKRGRRGSLWPMVSSTSTSPAASPIVNDFARCMREHGNANGSSSENDIHDALFHCLDVADREEMILIAMGTAFVVLIVAAIVTIVVLRILKIKQRKRNRLGPPTADWQRHLDSVQDSNQDVFTNVIIPEQPEEEDEQQHTRRDGHSSSFSGSEGVDQKRPWYRRLPWLSRKKTQDTEGAENGERRDVRQQDGRRRDDHVSERGGGRESPFIIPPAPTSRVGKRKVHTISGPVLPHASNNSNSGRADTTSTAAAGDAGDAGAAGVSRPRAISTGTAMGGSEMEDENLTVAAHTNGATRMRNTSNESRKRKDQQSSS